MADGHHVQIEVEKEELDKNTPLLINNNSPETTTLESSNKETNLDKTLQRLDLFLSLLGYKQSSLPRILLSWSLFSLIGVVLPIATLELFTCPGCVRGQIKNFELGIVVSQASLAAASLVCISHNLRKYGIRKFLFVDRYSGHVERFSDQYVQKISESKRLLLVWVVPCCLLKTAGEIVRLSYGPTEPWWRSAAVLTASVFSWAYVTTVFLSACILFHVVCSLQVIHFDDYGKLLEREPDALALLQEHARLRYYLSKISHRFRIYLLLQYLIVTICQFTTLFQTTEYNGMDTFINGGDFAVSSIVQVVGIILCLNAAAKISHRAQGIGALANKWHALMTCSASDYSSRLFRSNTNGSSFEGGDNLGGGDYSESDLESLDFTTAPTNSQLASYMSSYHKRLALVMYLQSNPGGITIFGWTVDRGLINTIFFIELSLVTFVLGKTIVVTSE